MNPLPVWIRWRDQRNGRARWHDTSQAVRKSIVWNVEPITESNTQVMPAVERLKAIASEYLEQHPEAEAVTVEHYTEFRESTREQARIRLAWFADRLTPQQHIANMQDG